MKKVINAALTGLVALTVSTPVYAEAIPAIGSGTERIEKKQTKEQQEQQKKEQNQTKKEPKLTGSLGWYVQDFNSHSGNFTRNAFPFRLTYKLTERLTIAALGSANVVKTSNNSFTSYNAGGSISANLKSLELTAQYQSISRDALVDAIWNEVRASHLLGIDTNLDLGRGVYALASGETRFTNLEHRTYSDAGLAIKDPLNKKDVIVYGKLGGEKDTFKGISLIYPTLGVSVLFDNSTNLTLSTQLGQKLGANGELTIPIEERIDLVFLGSAAKESKSGRELTVGLFLRARR